MMDKMDSKVKVGNKYKYIYEDDSNKFVYIIKIVNINYFREPSMIYAADAWTEDGRNLEDLVFFGDELLEKCELISDQ